ncbi:hypothetical protein MKZ38_001005 [Zalerion maritima]|uniref:NB-ARC domain-containing protein n=1 Tax=Zalerion maritima TaxID=339359 RepID=A0AAD5WTJ3_9PEZI|nr:hypothetical protein MKZ38_001005 [Zalerion maritima]
MYEAVDPSRWADVDRRLRKELKSNESARLLAIENVEILQTKLERLKQQRRVRPGENTWNRLNKVVTLLKPVAQAADVLAQGACLPSAVLWGALGVVVELVGSRTETLDNVLLAYESLLDVLPTVPSFTEALRESSNLQVAIVDVYDAFTALSVRSLKTFGRGSRMHSWNTFLWMRDRKLFQNSIQDLEALVRKARQEAGHALMEQRRAREAQTLGKVERNTEDILSALSIGDADWPRNQKTQTIRFTAPPKNPSFVGREERLGAIHRHLQPTSQTEQSAQQRSVVLCGLGGVGKTQLAIEYAHRFKNCYQFCFWVTCDSLVRAAEGFSEIARVLDLGDLGVVQNLGNVKHWFHTTYERWLLIFDNAERLRDMADFWPQSRNGAVLLTTQDARWLSQEQITLGLQLDSLTRTDGVDLVGRLFKHRDQSITEADAVRIVDEAGGLPLAIRQIASYILAEDMNTTLFFRNYHDHRHSKTVDAWEESATPWYSYTLATFLDVAFGKLSARGVSTLGIICFLDADKIQERFLCHGSSIEEEKEEEEDEKEDLDKDDNEEVVFHSPIESDKDIKQLCRYSLVSKCRTESGIDLSVHRQVKRQVLNRLTATQLDLCSSWVMQRLRQLFPRQTPFASEFDDENSNCAPWIKHILALRNAMPTLRRRIQAPEVLASLFLDGGIYLWAKGLLSDGKSLTGEAKTLCDTLPVGKSMTAQVYSFHASILSDCGDVDRSLKYFQRSLEILKSHLIAVRDMALDSDHALLANSWNNLAGIYNATHDYDKAEMYNELSVRQKQKIARKGLDVSYLLCLSYQNMASTYAGQMRYDEAAEYFGKATQLGDLTESTCRRAPLISHNFGIMRLEQGRTGEARELFETAWKQRYERHGDHPDTAASLHMLACCYHLMGDTDSLKIARFLLKDALRMLESRPSDVDQSRVARTEFKLSIVQRALDDAGADASREHAQQLYLALTGSPTRPSSEHEFDVLVPYI